MLVNKRCTERPISKFNVAKALKICYLMPATVTLKSIKVNFIHQMSLFSISCIKRLNN